ncbi:MAG: Flp pilus assembly complex ATPase component TadA [Actinobacteria bacterium]|nr:Flp pilus assembly complex ATPase component TadA [Actinomycetota bacterium]
MTLIDRPRTSPPPPGRAAADLVNRIHAVVGEALTQRHAADEAARRGRLAAEDERALSRKLIADELERLAAEALAAGRVPLGDSEEQELASAVFDRLHGLGRLQPLLDDPEIRDIHIPGAEPTWLSLRDGTKVRGPAIAESPEEVVELVATAARRLGRSERRWDNAHPELNLRLPNGDRLHALMAVTGRPTVTIRRHDFAIHRVHQLVELGLMDRAMGAFLAAAVRAKRTIIVAGGTGTGKTTTLRCLINEIPAHERLITIEDSLEIGLEHFAELHPDHETIEAREANTEGVGEFGLAAGVRAALRMDPDRVIVGEVRGGEVLVMLLAMSQGNDGSMCSIHADSSKGVFSRLAMYAAMTRERLAPEVTNLLVANAVDLIVHLAWVGGTRRVTSVREVTGVADSGQVASNEIWRPGPDGRAVPGVPPQHHTTEALRSAGFDPSVLQRPPEWLR